jgi:hypothetical protein
MHHLRNRNYVQATTALVQTAKVLHLAAPSPTAQALYSLAKLAAHISSQPVQQAVQQEMEAALVFYRAQQVLLSLLPPDRVTGKGAVDLVQLIIDTLEQASQLLLSYDALARLAGLALALLHTAYPPSGPVPFPSQLVRVLWLTVMRCCTVAWLELARLPDLGIWTQPALGDLKQSNVFYTVCKAAQQEVKQGLLQPALLVVEEDAVLQELVEASGLGELLMDELTGQVMQVMPGGTGEGNKEGKARMRYVIQAITHLALQEGAEEEAERSSER